MLQAGKVVLSRERVPGDRYGALTCMLDQLFDLEAWIEALPPTVYRLYIPLHKILPLRRGVIPPFIREIKYTLAYDSLADHPVIPELACDEEYIEAQRNGARILSDEFHSARTCYPEGVTHVSANIESAVYGVQLPSSLVSLQIYAGATLSADKVNGLMTCFSRAVKESLSFRQLRVCFGGSPCSLPMIHCFKGAEDLYLECNSGICELDKENLPPNCKRVFFVAVNKAQAQAYGQAYGGGLGAARVYISEKSDDSSDESDDVDVFSA